MIRLLLLAVPFAIAFPVIYLRARLMDKWKMVMEGTLAKVDYLHRSKLHRGYRLPGASAVRTFTVTMIQLTDGRFLQVRGHLSVDCGPGDKIRISRNPWVGYRVDAIDPMP